MKFYSPKLGKNVYIHPTASVEGRVTLRDQVNIWPGAVLRGDLNRIVIGKGSNIQDLSVVHVERDLECVVGENCVVGHRVILHGCHVGHGVLVGMGAIILNGARVGDGALIGAGAVVTEKTKVKPNSLYLGMPAKFIRKLTKREIRFTLQSAKRYTQYAKAYADGRFWPAAANGI